MHIGMATATKTVRMDFRARPDVKRDALTLAELHRCDLTELITDLIVKETDREIAARPELFADAAKRVAKGKEKAISRNDRPATRSRAASNGRARKR